MTPKNVVDLHTHCNISRIHFRIWQIAETCDTMKLSMLEWDWPEVIGLDTQEICEQLLV